MYKKFFCWSFFNFNIVFSVLFSIGIFISVSLARDLGNNINISQNSSMDIFYWLAPNFAFIQTGNFLLLWGGLLSFIAGVTMPTRGEVYKISSIAKSILKIFFSICLFISVCIVTTYLSELIFFTRRYGDFSIVKHSLIMLACSYLFLLFWMLIGFGLKLSIHSAIIVCAIGVIIQILDIYIIHAFFPNIEKYLPTSLSRQIIFHQFNFWEKSSWAFNNHSHIFITGPMITDKLYRPVSISVLHICIFLLWYLAAIYLLPITKSLVVKNKELKF